MNKEPMYDLFINKYLECTLLDSILFTGSKNDTNVTKIFSYRELVDLENTFKGDIYKVFKYCDKSFTSLVQEFIREEIEYTIKLVKFDLEYKTFRERVYDRKK